MHRAAPLILALCLSGCTASSLGLPTFPLGIPELRNSIKDTPPKPKAKQPEVAPAKVVAPANSVGPVVVNGAQPAANFGLASAMRAELKEAGFDLGYHAPAYALYAQISPADEGIRIVWTVKDKDGTQIGTVEQQNNVMPAVLEPGRNSQSVSVAKAALIGLLKHLPSPNGGAKWP